VPMSSDVLRQRIISTLSSKLDSDVALGDLTIRVFPGLRADGKDLRIRRRGTPADMPGLITVKSFHVDASLMGLWRKRVDHVQLDGLDISIPPKQVRVQQKEAKRAAEAADPDMLMRQTSRYFSALTDAFLAEGGTIDKFIGDAVMVFWNAPNPQPDHVARACRAVLAAKAVGERLNVEFEAEGLTPFFTRFGIHVGEAVVGNVGSTERMNYTALGNTVNLAARLEGLNKQAGTAVLVSEDVYLRVRDQFEFNALDAVVAKGMTKETRIFELVGVSA